MVIKNRISVKDYQFLHKSVGWKLSNDRIVRFSLKNSHMILSLYDEGKIIGMVRLVSDKATHGMITDMIVLPEKQGMGYGKLLLNELKVKKNSIKNVGLKWMIQHFLEHTNYSKIKIYIHNKKTLLLASLLFINIILMISLL